MQVVNKPANM